jgi:hypothetical protein
MSTISGHRKNHGMVRGTVVSYGTYTSAAIA